MSNLSSDVKAIIENDGGDLEYQVGAWVWVKSESEGHDELEAKPLVPKSGNDWLGCIVHIGSNFIEVREPEGRNGYRSSRILLKDAHKYLEFESNHLSIVSESVAYYRTKSQNLIAEVNKLVSDLGLTKRISNVTGSNSTALSTIVDHDSIDNLKTDLVEAKDNKLPQLEKDIIKANEGLKKWLMAGAMGYSIQSDEFRVFKSEADDRIRNVTLYAGIGEEAELIKDGEPAPLGTKLHVFQRKLFMDETALIDYDAGGMDFTRIENFDEWLCREHNLNTILSHPRSMVAFQVRRNNKERHIDTLLSAFVKSSMEQSDKITFIYIRNGEKVYRICTDLEFDELLFPTDVAGITEPAMVKMFIKKVNGIMTVREYESRLEEYNEGLRKRKEWFESNPLEKWLLENPQSSEHNWTYSNPYGSRSSFTPNDWEKFDESNLYFDEIKAHLSDKVKAYNQIALVLQGIFDRSSILVPTERVRLSDGADFEKHIKLVYDAENVLYEGEEPNFEEYREKCNQNSKTGDVFVGQQENFLKREAEKDNNRRNNSEYRDHLSEIKHHRPYGNGGPTNLAMSEKVFSGKARFTWLRESARYQHGDTLIKDSITVKLSELFNVSAYKKGDYKQFYRDPRMREKYLSWAPFLLAAEDYVSGKRQVLEVGDESL
jgi:hypothetical protein